MRPPLSGRSPILYTALAVRGLKAYSPAGRRDETSARIARARAFLRTAAPDQAFKLLGLIWSGAPSAEITVGMKHLLALQGRDGVWAQRTTMVADSYATGQALYALRASGAAASSSADFWTTEPTALLLVRLYQHRVSVRRLQGQETLAN